MFSHHANSFGVNQDLALQESSLILQFNNVFSRLYIVVYCFVQAHHPVVTLICLRILGGCFANNFSSGKNSR